MLESAYEPSAATAQAGQPIDRAHLARMTLGDASLEREVLQLFDRQSALLLARMHGAEANEIGAFAHTLKGSALGIGAWPVAQSAEAVELAVNSSRAERDAAVVDLAAAVSEARAVIADLLRAH